MISTSRYLIPKAGKHQVSETISKSRFITTLDHTPSQEQARALIEDIHLQFPDASHHCWAFAAGPPGDTARIGCSDAGEPHNTAGRPMLQALLHSQVGEITAVVTRYFGGVKLGTGGLVRAYTHMVQLGLESLPLMEKVDTTRFRVILDYASVDPLKLFLPEIEARILSETYTADAEFILEVPIEYKKQMEQALKEITAGIVLLEPLPSA